MKSYEIRSKFLEFFRKRGHAIIPSASLVTPDEKGITNPTLFNTAGMQPLVPYLLGKAHPLGKRLADSQKCLRTVDIDDIGDKTHATFFEMLGNWSLGDYFKEDAIKWSYEFLTSKEEGLGLDPRRLYVTVFEGDENAPKDVEAEAIWKKIFKDNKIEGERIFFMPASSNWWEAGDNGPCGPDTEMFYDIKNRFGGKGITKEEYIDADSKRDVVEIWNDVFMQYEKKDGKIIGNLPAPSVDTGAGLERLTMTLQGVDNIYDTDLLSPVLESIKKQAKIDIIRPQRIIADHFRAAVFLIADGVLPSNTDRGYILRRLIRRAGRYSRELEVNNIAPIVQAILDVYKDLYDLQTKKDMILNVLEEEISKFKISVNEGIKKIEKILATKVPIDSNKFLELMNDTNFLLRTAFLNRRNKKPYSIDSVSLSEKDIERALITGKEAFDIFQTFGLPIEIIVELAHERRLLVDRGEYRDEMSKHQALSRAGAEQKFKGGLADANDEMVVRYHTTTHLLHQALFDVLGPNVMQKGSNITAERLRFDFAHGAKMTDDEKKRVEDIVNEKIAQKLPMNNVILPREEAEKTGAKHFFGEKYGDQISIYFIGNDLSSAYSKEFCGGPHVKNTAELAGPDGKWHFKIQKEEAVSAGVRRIKAVLV